MINRRIFSSGIAASVLAAAMAGCAKKEEGRAMYGIIGKMLANAGQRDELIDILLAGTKGMPGCLSYVVAKDNSDDNAIWITEVWDNQESHQASLSLESVQAAITKGRPMIAGFGERYELSPVGGHGLG